MTADAAFDVDLFVIGAGSGGVRAARIAAGYGARVMVAEAYRVGGTCVIRGCVPKKLLVYASRFPDDFEDAGGFGWSVPEADFDWTALIAAKDREIARLEGIYAANLRKAGVEIVSERAVLDGPNAVRLASGRRITARHILIATGGRPSLPTDLPGAELAITSNEAFHLPALPKRVVIAGGGYIAVEFAGIFRGLGSEVTLLYRGDEILRHFDGDLRRGVTEAHLKRGIRIVTGAVFTALEATTGGIRAHLSTGETIDTDQVMFAIGRVPATEGLGLDTAGVETGPHGEIVVDAFSATSVPSIHAVGDVTNRVALTPVAIREGHAFADTVFGGKPTPVDHRDIPTAVFSTPEIGPSVFRRSGPRRLSRSRRLPHRVPADEGDAVRPRRAHGDEAPRRRGERPGRRRACAGTRRGRDGAAPRHPRAHGRDQGGLRPHGGAASLGGRGVRDAARALLALRRRQARLIKTSPARARRRRAGAGCPGSPWSGRVRASAGPSRPPRSRATWSGRARRRARSSG